MKICIQAGHKNRTSGGTGAPGERDWTSEIVPKIAAKLRELGFEVYETDAYAYNDSTVTNTDWDLFLSLHYDADIYNDRGGFADYPEPSTDFATKESQRITKVLTETYFPQTGIPNKPERSNKNTRYYYMWKHLSKDTPCVLLEAGVGWRKPEDHHTLHLDQPRVINAIANGVNKALKGEAMPDEYEKCRLDRDAWWTNLNKILASVGFKLESDNYDHVREITNQAIDKIETAIQGEKQCQMDKEDLQKVINDKDAQIDELIEALEDAENTPIDEPIEPEPPISNTPELLPNLDNNYYIDAYIIKKKEA